MACSTLWTDPKRGKLVAFTEPAFYQPLYVYARVDDARFSGKKEELNNKDVVFSMIDGGYSAAVVERHFPDADINSLAAINTFAEVILNVANGKADAVISDPIFIDDFNQNNPGKKLVRVYDEPIVVFGNAFAVSIHEPEMKEMISNTVKYMIQTGEIKEITKDFREKYPGSMILPKKTYE